MGGFSIKEDRPTPKDVYNWRVYLVSAVIAWGAVTYGYDTAFIGVAVTVQSFKNSFGLSAMSAKQASDTTSNITSSFQAGAFFGCIFSWGIMDTWGRRLCLQAACFVFMIGALIQTTATHQLSYIFAGRVLTGLGVGAISSVGPTYIAELSPPSIRGQLVGMYEIAYQFGSMVGFWINYGIGKHISAASPMAYRIPYAVQLIPAGVLLIGVSFVPESMHFLLAKGREKEAIQNVTFLRQLEADHQYIHEELSMIREQIDRERSVMTGHSRSFWGRLQGSFHEVFLKGIRNRLALVTLLFVFQAFSGVNSINYYSPTIFKSLGIQDTSLYTGIYGVVKAAGCFFFYVWFIDRWGRRWPAITSNVLCGLCMLYLAVYVKVAHPAPGAVLSPSQQTGGTAAVAFIMIFSFCWAFGLNGLPWVVSGEIAPTNLRPFFGAYAAAGSYLWQFVITKALPSMIDSMGSWGIFLFFSLMMLTATAYCFFFLPETKGLPLTEMDKLFGFARLDGVTSRGSQDEVSQNEDDKLPRSSSV